MCLVNIRPPATALIARDFVGAFSLALQKWVFKHGPTTTNDRIFAQKTVYILLYMVVLLHSLVYIRNMPLRLTR